jgi:hypothetical protein
MRRASAEFIVATAVAATTNEEVNISLIFFMDLDSLPIDIAMKSCVGLVEQLLPGVSRSLV